MEGKKERERRRRKTDIQSPRQSDTQSDNQRHSKWGQRQPDIITETCR